ncbi:hypothetical protein ACFX12_022556 [Malus domestica]
MLDSVQVYSILSGIPYAMDPPTLVNKWILRNICFNFDMANHGVHATILIGVNYRTKFKFKLFSLGRKSAIDYIICRITMDVQSFSVEIVDNAHKVLLPREYIRGTRAYGEGKKE